MRNARPKVLKLIRQANRAKAGAWIATPLCGFGTALSSGQAMK
jgi:hypothetical protein